MRWTQVYDITLENLGYVKHSNLPLLYINASLNTSILITDIDVEKRYMSALLPLTHEELIACTKIIVQREKKDGK